METAATAQSIAGDKPYQKRARAALPLLVRQAYAGSPLRYGELAAELGMPNPRNLNYVLGSIGQAIKNLSELWRQDVPPIQAIVINKNTGLPGEGVGWFITGKEGPWGSALDFRTLPKAKQRRLVEAALQEVFAYPRWFDVLEALGLEAVRTDYQDIVSNASSFRTGPETEEHRRLKEYVARTPQLVGLPRRLIGETEYALPSRDTVDVLFGEQDDWVVAEVKSKLSPEADIVRGLFQCIKYRAVIEAYQASRALPQGARSVLVLQGVLPDRLVPLKNILGVEVVDCVEPR
jgi:hypothetical protein